MRAIILALAGITLLTTALYLNSAPATRSIASGANKAEFHRLRKQYGVSVEGLADMEYRYSVYKANKQFIAESNAKNAGYTSGVGPFTLYTFEEFAERMNLRTIGSADEVDASRIEADFNNVGIAEKDWQGIYDVTDVKSQGACQAGYAFATAGLVESSVMRFRQKNESLSAQEIVDCSYGQNNGCKGGLADKSMAYVKKSSIGTDNLYPYVGTRNTCTKKENVATIPGFYYIYNGTDIREAIDNQPVIVAFQYDKGMQNYTGGVYLNRDPNCGKQINHFALAVGYLFKDKNSSYYMIKNSFGDKWGIKGYMNLDVLTCGVTYNKYNVAMTESGVETSAQ